MKTIQCTDGMCGAQDCQRCFPPTSDERARFAGSMPDIPATGDIEDYQYFRKCHERKYYPED